MKLLLFALLLFGSDIYRQQFTTFSTVAGVTIVIKRNCFALLLCFLPKADNIDPVFRFFTLLSAILHYCPPFYFIVRLSLFSFFT
jgi:hypothetical protein